MHVRTQTCCARAQYYFETIFPRIPKPVQDDFVSKLTSMGLPSRAVGNAGQGGADRRGIEEANRRPASVKASLCGLQALLTALQGLVLDASYKLRVSVISQGACLPVEWPPVGSAKLVHDEEVTRAAWCRMCSKAARLRDGAQGWTVLGRGMTGGASGFVNLPKHQITCVGVRAGRWRWGSARPTARPRARTDAAWAPA